MNKGVFQGHAVQPMITGNPNWWSLNNSSSDNNNNDNNNNNGGLTGLPQHPSVPLPFPYLSPSSSLAGSSIFNQYPSASNSLPLMTWQDSQGLPESWSQLLLGGLVGHEERRSTTQFQQEKKMEGWEEQVLHHHQAQLGVQQVEADKVKQERSECGSYVSYNGEGHHENQFQSPRSAWAAQVALPVSSPRSCVTSFSSNMLDFSTTNNNRNSSRFEAKHPKPDHSSESNSTSSGSAFKKARVQASSAQSTFKVRKEKLGDRVTALHQLVSPFGKTDTASVLLEAIGYIRFLHSQIEALSSPYLGSGNPDNMRQSAQRERNCCIFPEDTGQLLNEVCMKRRGASDEQGDEAGQRQDLKSRGLCLVPLSFTIHVESDNGADYWSPAIGGGFR
ncbi:Transcription factor bHLH68 [Acorus gramineus]|uniref:Transcription factor bHLH68 n=1 Tax=Acorus gramineus TaxID=55184 RepID=A0AAV9APP8_ACOGR|nr:Transcription factor bHLH68 [Acorus gramineus]